MQFVMYKNRYNFFSDYSSVEMNSSGKKTEKQIVDGQQQNVFLMAILVGCF